MRPEDKSVFAAMWATAIDACNRKMPQCGTIEYIFDQLSGWPIEDVIGAIRDHQADTDRGHFPPTVADVIRHLNRRTMEAPLYAWKVVLANLNPYASPEFDDMRVAAAVAAIGGWTAMCAMTYAELERAKPRFVEAYFTSQQANGGLLKGLVETHNKHKFAKRFGHETVRIITSTEEQRDAITAALPSPARHPGQPG